jgi:hypothetical protein
MVTIKKYKGQFGNQLFQYCFARLLAERVGQGLRVPPIDGLPDLITRIDRGENCSGLDVVTDLNSDRSYWADDVNYEVWGFFQKYRYYQWHRDRIFNWLMGDFNYERHFKYDTIVHIRKGDFAQSGNVLSADYYDQAFKRLRNSIYTYDTCKRHVCAIGVLDIDDDALDVFMSYPDVELVVYEASNRNHMDDFKFMLNAYSIIGSNSTFSWWGSWLSRSKCNIQPVPTFGYFSDNHNHQEMRISGYNKYHYIPAKNGLSDG